MKLKIVNAPWCNPTLTEEFKEASEILADNVWREASIKFYAVREAKLNNSKSAPKGMQRYINEILDSKFAEAGWDGDGGCYFKNKTWIRITFRHQMSVGTDFLNAMKVCKREGVELAVIIAANKETLKIISPNDAAAIISFDKLLNEMVSLEGVIDIPLVIGELTPLTKAPEAVSKEILKERPRDISVPNNVFKNQKRRK